MALLKRVELQRIELCEKCKEPIDIGLEAVKDRRTKPTKYYHVNHFKK